MTVQHAMLHRIKLEHGICHVLQLEAARRRANRDPV